MGPDYLIFLLLVFFTSKLKTKLTLKIDSRHAARVDVGGNLDYDKTSSFFQGTRYAPAYRARYRRETA